MNVISRSEFSSHRTWFINVLSGKDIVLSHTSALELLGQFPGYVNENQIDVYAKAREPYDNINWNIVSDFKDLDIVNIGELRCTSFNQTVNDMLRDYDSIDDQSLAQALSNYYHHNGESFDGIKVAPQYEERYRDFQSWAEEFYTYE